MTSKVSQFVLTFGMLQAYGCIDGTHIPIKTPNENLRDYFNYKQFFSLNVQAVCDYKGYFMDVDCRWPGSCHDAKVYANSKINETMQDNNEMPKQFKQILPGEAKILNSMLRTARNSIKCVRIWEI